MRNDIIPAFVHDEDKISRLIEPMNKYIARADEFVKTLK